jgi:predicted transcriptional regulator
VLVAYWGKKLEISGIEIAKYLGVSNAAISYLVRRDEQYARERGVNLLFYHVPKVQK